MVAQPVHSDFEARTNATYEALMWALSRPGLVRRMPAVGLAGIVETLIDRECAVFTDDPALSAVVARTGAEVVAMEAADHVFLTAAPAPGDLARLRCGSDLYPDDGATVVCPVRIGEGQRLSLTGPGVNGRVEIALTDVEPGLWQRRAQVMRYPMGFEMFLVDDVQVIGLPRTTVVEVL